MKSLSPTARLIAALAAVAITLGLLDAGFVIAEPQRSVLTAKLERAEQPAPTRLAALTALTAGLPIAK
jgi:hypothetical protein